MFLVLVIYPEKLTITPEFNKSTTENFAARLKQASLVNETDIIDKPKDLDKKTTSNETKHVPELKKITKVCLTFFSLVKVTLIMMEHNFT